MVAGTGCTSYGPTADTLWPFAHSHVPAPCYEEEVERYIRGLLADQVADGKRILVSGEIVAVASHDSAPDPDGSGLTISWLTGTRLETGERLSDALVATLIHDALRTDRSPVLAGLVAEDNVRSRRMCTRAGLVEDSALEARLVNGERRLYVFVQGAFSRPTGP